MAWLPVDGCQRLADDDPRRIIPASSAGRGCYYHYHDHNHVYLQCRCRDTAATGTARLGVTNKWRITR